MASAEISITLIGAGRLGGHLARRLSACEYEIRQVYSRQIEKAKRVAEAVGALAVNHLEEIQAGADLYILAVPDDQITALAARLREILGDEVFVVHTSGATPATLLAAFFSHYGNFYPLQTFSTDVQPDFTRIPVIIDAGTKEDLLLLEEVGRKTGLGPYPLNDQQRKTLHLSAVFANNFTNHLLEIAFRILEKDQIPADLIKPLIEETFRKVKTKRPAEAQTGPAIRGDQKTIERHLNLLKEKYPEWEELYRIITGSIEGGND